MNIGLNESIRIVSSLIVYLFIASCSKSHNESVPMIYMPLDKSSTFIEMEELISSVEILPLSYPDEVILSDDNLVKANDNIIIFVDRLHSKKIHIFNKDGGYRATLAAEGRGPEDYLDMASTQIVDNKIMVYSYHKKSALFYDFDRKFIDHSELSFIPYNLYKTDSCYWGYTGYGNGQMAERVVRMNLDGEIVKKYLPTEDNILPTTELEDIFIPSNYGLLFRESISNKIYTIGETGAELFACFDFGKYTIPSNFYTQSSAMEAADLLFKSDFAVINQIVANGNTVVTTIDGVTASDSEKILHAIACYDGSKWSCIKIDSSDHPLFKSLKGITTNNELMLLANEERITDFASKYPSLLNIDKEKYNNSDKYHLVLCKLKH